MRWSGIVVLLGGIASGCAGLFRPPPEAGLQGMPFRMTIDVDAATAQMKRVYPALERIETVPAWPLPAPPLPTALRAASP